MQRNDFQAKEIIGFKMMGTQLSCDVKYNISNLTFIILLPQTNMIFQKHKI